MRRYGSGVNRPENFNLRYSLIKRMKDHRLKYLSINADYFINGDCCAIGQLPLSFMEKLPSICHNSVSVAALVPLPSWKTRVFEAAGKWTGHMWKLPSLAPPQPWPAWPEIQSDNEKDSTRQKFR